MHSNEAICKRNPVEQSMCAQSAFPIRKQPKNEKKKFFAKGVKTFFFFKLWSVKATDPLAGELLMHHNCIQDNCADYVWITNSCI